MKFLVDEAVEPEGPFKVDEAVVPPAPSMGEVVKSAGPTAAGMLQQAVGGGMRAVGEVTGLESVAEAGAGIAESGQFNIEEARLPGMTLGQEFVQQGVANVGVMAPSLMAGAAFGVPAVLAGAGVTAFGPTYHQSREARLGIGRSLLHGAVDSAIEIGTELLPAKYLFGQVGQPILARLGKAIAADYGGEVAATVLQDINAMASYNPEMSIRDVVNDVVMTMGSQLISSPLTAGLGATMAGTVAGMRKLQERAGFAYEQPAGQVAPREEAQSAGILPQNPPVVEAAQPAPVPVAEPIVEPDLMKSRWVQEHAASQGYQQTGQDIFKLDPKTRPVVLNAQGEADATPLSNIDLKPGEVVVVGPLWEGHTEEYMKLVQQEAQAFAKEVMGSKVAIVLATGLPENAAGVAVTGFATDGTPIAYINPRHIYDSMLQRKELGKTSLHAEAEAQYSLYHEFGHVLRQFALQDSTDKQQAALEADFRTAAEGVVSGELKATDFLLRYSSPWKIAKGFGLDDYGGAKGDWSAKSADRFVQYIISNKKSPDPNLDVTNTTALSFLQTLAKRTGGKTWQDVFNFDEFIAEQHARWMRSTKRAQTGPLGQFFTDMNALMQRYFNWLVRTKRVGKPSDLGPTEAYKKFVNRLVTANKRLSEPQIATPEILKKAKKNAKKLFYDLNPDGSESHNADTAALTEEQILRPEVVVLANRWRTKYGETKSPFFLSWAGNWELASTVDSLRYAQHTDNRTAIGDARQAVRSMQVKLLSAKLDALRVGGLDNVVTELERMIAEVPGALNGQYPKVALLRHPDGSPMVVYHGTTFNFDIFSKTNDIGYHFGTDLAANQRIGFPNADLPKGYEAYEGAHILPVYLSLANPMLSPDLKSWTANSVLLQLQKVTGVSDRIYYQWQDRITKIMSDTNNPGWPMVQDLVRAEVTKIMKEFGGFDGVKYINNYEHAGSESYIVFDSNQVKSALGNAGTFSRGVHKFNWDYSSAAAMGDEAPLRKLTTTDPEIDVTPYLEAGRVIRKKWWFLEQLRHVGIDLRSFEVNLQQWQHIAQRLNGLPFVQRFVDLSRMFTEEKNLNVKFPSETVVNGYKQLGKTQIEQLRKLLIWETDGKAHRTEVFEGFLPDGRPAKVRQVKDRAAFVADVQKQLGFTPDALTLDYFDRIRTAMHNQLEALYMAAAEKAGVATELTSNMLGEFGDLLVDAKSEDLQKLQALLDTPQYPWSRFGKYAIIVEQRTTDDKGNVSYTPVHYRHFEFSKDRDTAFKGLHLDPDQRGRVFDYFDDYVGFSVIPQSFIDVVIRRAGFDPNSAQADELRALAAVQRNTNLFKRFEEDFKLTDKSEHDVLKDFADFSGHLAALTAKVKYRRHLSLAVAEARKAVSLLDSQGVNSSDLQLLHQYMHQQLEYGMTPQDELQGLRSFITKALLFGNVRAAAINTTSVLNTAAYLDGLISKYNVLSWPSLMPLVKSAIQSVGGINRLDGRISAEELQLIQDAEARGITDQSYSYHLAAAADSGVMYRLNRSKSKWGTKVSEVGMLPFRAIERYTRRVGLLTAYRVAKAHPEILDGKTPEQFAKEALYLTQADYTAFNRPRSQQGLKAAALIFFTYTQNMVALFGGTLGGATAARMFLIYSMLGGLMGLPFAEDLMNLSNWVWRRIFKGDTDLRVAAREVANSIPYLGPVALRGVMHNIGGFDLSHSVSMGRVIPGLDSFAQSNMKSVDESFGSFAFDLMGPLGGYARGWLQAGAAMVNEPGVQSAIRLAQAAAPSQRSLMDLALFASQSGSPAEVQGYAGQIITKEQDGSVRELSAGELLGKALGFNPEIISRNREVDFLQRETATFWTQRRKKFMDLHWQAVQLRDPEMRADVRDAIREFNASVPDRHLKISGEDIQRSMKQRERIRSLEERGKSPVKRYNTIYSDIEAAFGG